MCLACMDTQIPLGRALTRTLSVEERQQLFAEAAARYGDSELRLNDKSSVTPEYLRGLHRWQVGDVHRERLRVLGLPHHRVHDSRHFYAIRAVRAGTPYELVARQLGHADVQMVARVYGRYAPHRGATSGTTGNASLRSSITLRKARKATRWVHPRVGRRAMKRKTRRANHS